MHWNGSTRRRVHVCAFAAGVAAIHVAMGLMLIQPVETQGLQFFVAVNGSAAGTGTIDKPWDLQTALNHPPIVAPGSTISIRGGTYKGHFVSRLNGTSSAPIIVRNHAGERVTIDNPSDCDTINMISSYTWYWGLELASSGVKRKTPYSGSYCGQQLDVRLDRGIAFRNNGSFNKIINCVIHDNQQGVGNWGTWTNNPGLEVYGTLIYYNGGEQTGGTRDGWGLGHGTYVLSKSTGATRLADNIVHTNFVTGIRVGDEGVFNPHVEGNVSYLNGDHMTKTGGRNLYVGGGNNYDSNPSAYVPMSGAVIRRNYTYYRPNPLGYGPGNLGYSEGLHAGLWWPGASGEIVGNYLAGKGGGDTLALGYWNHFTTTRCDGNTIYGMANAYATQQCQSGINTYYSARPSNAVFVRPNAYEPGRAHLVIYNWQMLPAVQVNLATAGLSEGETFEIRDAMNYYGAPVTGGVYTASSPVVSVSMQGLTRAPMAGEADVSVAYRPLPHSAPEFGAFILVPGGSGAVEAPPPPPPPAYSCDTINSGSFFGCYFDNKDFTDLRFTRTDPAINFDWGNGSPDTRVGADTFSVRWQGRFDFTAGDYDFTVSNDDGVRVYLDDVQIIDRWVDQTAAPYTVRGPVAAGTHTIRMEYYENAYAASARLTWTKLATAPGAPRNLTAKRSNMKVTLTWAAPTTGGPFTGYRIEAGKASGASTYVKTLGNVTTVTLTDLGVGRHYIRVRAINSTGVGPASNEVSVRLYDDD
jgi:hypothetical protein